MYPRSQNHSFFLFISSTIFSRKRAYKNDKFGEELLRSFMNIGKTEIKLKQTSQRYLRRSSKLYIRSIFCVFIAFYCVCYYRCPPFPLFAHSPQIHPVLPQTIPISLSMPLGHAERFFGYFPHLLPPVLHLPPHRQQLSLCSRYLCFSFNFVSLFSH